MYEPIRGGTRGGAAEFKWTDVSADKDREHYLGHSINAPTGRWQKNKDVHWYSRDDEQSAADRAEEMRRVKEAEEEALSVALGFKPTIRADPDAPSAPGETGENKGAEDMQPSEDIQKVLAVERMKREKAERKAEKEKKKAEKEQRRAIRHERKKERREREDERKHHDREPRRHHGDRLRDHDPHRRGRPYSRSRSPPNPRERRFTRSPSSSRSPPRRMDRDDRYRRPVQRSITPPPPPSRRRADYPDARMRTRSPPPPPRRGYSPHRERNGNPPGRQDSPPRRPLRSRSPMREDIPVRRSDYRRRLRSPPPRRDHDHPPSPPVRRRHDPLDRRSRTRSPHPIVVP